LGLKNKIDYSERYYLDSARLSITTKSIEKIGEQEIKIYNTFKDFLDRISLENSTMEKTKESQSPKIDLKSFQERLEKQRQELQINTPSK
jgi:energy-converting hydrogenase A subunit M